MKRVFAIVFLLLLVAGKSFSQFSVSLSGSTLITTGWSIGGYASVVDSTVQLTTPSTNENGYVYFDSAVNLTSCAQFTVDFDYQIIRAGGSALADGIAFFYIRNPPVGFITGGGLGLPNPVTGLVFTLDTYDNDGDGLNPESELYGYTTASTYSPTSKYIQVQQYNSITTGLTVAAAILSAVGPLFFIIYYYLDHRHYTQTGKPLSW